MGSERNLTEPKPRN